MTDHRSRVETLPRVLLLGLLLMAPPAAAHANLVAADPGPNTRVDQAPEQLALRFSEPLEETHTGVEVVGPDGTDRAQEVTITGDQRRELRVTLEPLPDGLHTVRWWTLSAADGHTKSGVHLLAVNASLAGPGADGGNGSAPVANATIPEPEAGSTPGPGEAAVRGLGFAGATLAVGLPVVLLVVPPLAAASLPERRLQVLAAAGAGLAAGASLGLAGLLAARIGADLETALATTNGTRLAWQAGLFGLGGLLLAASLLTRDEARRGAFLGAGAAAGAGGLVATSLAGHAATVEGARTLALVADWLHQFAVAVWIAGVVALLAATLSSRARGEDVADLVRRLSPVFVAAVVAIVATGSYASWVHLQAVADLWTTGYGQALSAKILLLLPLAALGYYHRYVLLPGFEADGGPSLSRLRRSVALEVGLMIVVLAAAGILTNLSPPGPAGPGGPVAGVDGNATEDPADELQGVLHTVNDSGYEIAFAVRPQPVTVGAQNVTVQVTPPEEGLPANAKVVLNLKPPSDPYGEGETLDLSRWKNDTWSHEGPVFVESGAWRALLALQGKDTYIQGTFEVDVR